MILPRKSDLRLVFTSIAAAAVALLPAGTHADNEAESAGSLWQPSKDGPVRLDFRYRFDHVIEDGFDEDASASILRTRIRLDSGAYAGFSAQLEADNVTALGVDDYNSTENGKTQFPVIPTPEGSDINQAWLAFAREAFSARIGRQRIVLDDMRIIGSKPWQHNEQTYDGVRLQFQPTRSLEIDASYVDQVNRIFGPDDGSNPAKWFGDNFFLRSQYEVTPGHRLIAFAYFVDVDPQEGFSAGQTVNNSSDSFGAEYRGRLANVNLRVALATQGDAGLSQLEYQAPYYAVEASSSLEGVTLSAGHEVLGSDNNTGFSTPLANGHRHNGWADKFLTIPADGLKDTWISLNGKLGEIALTARYHDFRAESSRVSFGDEVDLQAQWSPHPKVTLTAKAAFFQTRSTFRYPDTSKAWLILRLQI
jgi:hypothetical protein